MVLMIFLIVLFVLALFGRLACSTICPLGWIQELLYKIPMPKKFKDLPHDKQLRYLKYFVLVLVIVYIPTSQYIPDTYGWWLGLLIFKITTFSLIFISSLFLLRPFCKYLCPIGLFLGFFNKISLYKYRKKDNCNTCGFCKRDCKMSLEPFKDFNSIECIRCGRCLKKCPRKSLKEEYFYVKKKEEEEKNKQS